MAENNALAAQHVAFAVAIDATLAADNGTSRAINAALDARDRWKVAIHQIGGGVLQRARR